MSAEIEGRAICDDRAASCRCAKSAGHVEAGDPEHACHPDRCTGSWFGSESTGDWQPGRFPYNVSAPSPWEFA